MVNPLPDQLRIHGFAIAEMAETDSGLVGELVGGLERSHVRSGLGSKRHGGARGDASVTALAVTLANEGGGQEGVICHFLHDGGEVVGVEFFESAKDVFDSSVDGHRIYRGKKGVWLILGLGEWIFSAFTSANLQRTKGRRRKGMF